MVWPIMAPLARLLHTKLRVKAGEHVFELAQIQTYVNPMTTLPLLCIPATGPLLAVLPPQVILALSSS